MNLCLKSNLERRVRRIWCVGGPAMPLGEVAHALFMTPEGLRAALSNIPDLSYVTIRIAGLKILFDTGSTEGRALGFLVDGDAFEILDHDARAGERLISERDRLVASIG